MPQFDRGDTTIYYEEHGRGFPLLLIAPGGMNSTVDGWSRAAVNPLALYGDDFRLIAMDQRNAGRSRGPLDVDDPWGSLARDQLGLLDHLGIGAFLVMGCCIGGSYILKLLEEAPDRVAAAVLEQPIGVTGSNAQLFATMWRTWGADLLDQRADIDRETLEAFGGRMWNRDFVVSVSPEFVATCTTPMLVLPGIDEFHPTTTGRGIAALAPNGEVLEPWKDTPRHVEEAGEAVRRFLLSHTPHERDD